MSWMRCRASCHSWNPGPSAAAGWDAIWRDLGLEAFWEQRLSPQRGEVDWTKVLQVLVLNRLSEPGSEFRIHRHRFDASALDELLGVDFETAEKDRLHPCLDRLLAHKKDLSVFLKERWRNLFNARFEALLYDLTSTYLQRARTKQPKM